MVAPLVSISPQLIPRYCDNNGNALSGGLLATYIAGTTSPLATYSDSTGSAALPNPIVLSSRGEPMTGGSVTCGIWLTEGLAYKFQLQTSTGSPIWTLDNVLAGGAFSFYGGTTTGSANAYALANPQITSYTTPFEVSFIANFSNTGAATLNINGLGTKNIYRATPLGPAALVGGEIVTNQIVTVIYDGTEFQLTSDSAASPVLRSYLAGLTLSNDVGTPNTVLDIAAGSAVDSTNTILMTGGAFTKSTAGTWVSGTGNNGMGVGLTIAVTTWYHVFQISVANVTDYYFDTSVTAANKPVGTNFFRRIGSFLTDGAAHIIAFSQNGDEFLWLAAVADASAAGVTSTAALQLLTVPTGLIVNALFRGDWVTTVSGSAIVVITSPSENSLAASDNNASMYSYYAGTTPAVATLQAGDFNIRTNTAAQVRVRSGANSGNLSIGTKGWIDTRGRNA